MIRGLLDQVAGDDADQELSVALDAADVFEAIRNNRRREVILRLAAIEANESTDQPTTTIAALAEHIAAVEGDAETVDRDHRRAVYIGLHQSHLGKLDDLGIVSYDPRGTDVVAAADVTVLSELITAVEEACDGGEQL